MSRIKNKIKTLTVFLTGVVFFWSSSAFAKEAYIPFYAEVATQPNVLLLIDTSVSLKSELGSGSTVESMYGSRKIDILRGVLTGTGRIPVTYTVGTGKSAVTYQLYKGRLDGEYNLYDELSSQGVFLDILLVRYNNSTGRYELVPEGPIGGDTVWDYYDMLAHKEQAYFVFLSNYDHPLQTGGNAPGGISTITNARYPFSKFLRDHKAETAQLHTVADISNDGISLPREIYKAKTTLQTGDILFSDYLVANYGKYDNLKISRVRSENKCYKIGNKTYPCYVPVPWTDPITNLTEFVVWDSADFNYFNADVSSVMYKSAKSLYDFILFLQANGLGTNYNSYVMFASDKVICGDGKQGGITEECPVGSNNPVTCNNDAKCPNSNRGIGNPYRPVFRIIQDGSDINAVKVHPAPWTKQEISDNIWNKIPMATKVNQVVTAIDGSTFTETYYKGTGSTKEANAIRWGLGLDEVSWDAGCLDTPKYCNLFDDCNSCSGTGCTTSNCKFIGLPYTSLAINTPGVMDTYADKLRFGLMVSDKSQGEGELSDSFPWDATGDTGKRGGMLYYNYPDESFEAKGLAGLLEHNNLIQEIITQQDLNDDGIYPPERKQFIAPDGTSPTPWMLRDAISYFYAVWFYDGRYPELGWVKDADTSNPSGPYEIVDPMYHRWTPSKWNMTDLNGHILLNDPSYYYGCRSNNVILLTDACQTGGMQINVVLAAEQKYVELLKKPGKPGGLVPFYENPNGWKPTKLYLIGFDVVTTGSCQNSQPIEQLNLMAQTSCLADVIPGVECDYDPAPEPGDDERDIAYWLDAKNGEQLRQAFTKIFDTILRGSYSRSAPVINADFSAGAAGFFDVAPNEDKLWIGHLVYADLTPLQTLDSGSVTITTTIDAADLLRERPDSDRKIFTSLSNNTKISFTTSNAATLAPYLFPGYPTFVKEYDQDGSGTLTSADAEMLINFVRAVDGCTYKDGDTNPDNNMVRRNKLGAIFHSTPVSAGAPPKEALQGDPSYQAYADAYADAPELIYVGALDGMLHTFYFEDPDQGGPLSILDEAWAYIPRFIMNKLWHLRAGENEVLVDGDPNLAVMRIHHTAPYPCNPAEPNCWCNSDEEWCWQTVLFQCLRDGGPACFSLNVTSKGISPGDSVKIRWEFTDPNESGTDSILGNTWSLPMVDELLYCPPDKDCTTSPEELDTRVAVIFGGGTSLIDGGTYQGSWLYILNGDSGTPIKTILVPSTNQFCDIDPKADPPDNLLTADNYADECDLSASNTNQVPGDVLLKDVDYDGFPDWGYFGDLQGRVWKLNIHDPNPEHWGICLFFDSGDNGYEHPLNLNNNACEDENSGYGPGLDSYGATEQPDCVTPAKRRPFFYKPDITPAPIPGAWLVYVGTGHIETKYEVETETARNYVFALLDEDDYDECTYAKIWFGEPGEESGWPIQLDENEKLISPPILTLPEKGNPYKGRVTFRSFKPNVTTNPCSPGTVYKWGVDFDTGRGALFANGSYVRKVAEAGFPGKSLVLGNIELSLNPPTGTQNVPEIKGQITQVDKFRGFYYWWIK